MGNALDIEGMRFGRLIAIKPTDKRSGNGGIIWECKCDCGNKAYVSASTLKFTQKSCGCLMKEKMMKANTTHGKSYNKLYRIWVSLKSRCLNEKSIQYCDYGGRGIKVCGEWIDDFMNFYKWAIENGYKNNLTIDRIDNDGNYEPSNCRWVNRKVQGNNRRNNHYITIDGETKTLQEWGEHVGMKPNTILCRIRKGWSNKDAIFTPLLKVRK